MCVSVNFVSQSLKHKVHAMIKGMCRKGNNGFPHVFKQEEVKGEENIRAQALILKKEDRQSNSRLQGLGQDTGRICSWPQKLTHTGATQLHLVMWYR